MVQLARALVIVVLLSATHASAVTIDWSPVGNPGNANDPADGDGYTPGIQTFGAVPYAYNIGTYDVTTSQYVEFLNTKDAMGANALGLYSSNMNNPTYGGVTFGAGNANGSKYSVIAGRENHPVNYINWYAAVRFANWVNNGQGNGDTETGAYTLLGNTPIPTNGLNVTRNAGATVFLPSEDEWYKAAYYNPGTSSYFQYPTSTNSVPTPSAPTALPNHANFPGWQVTSNLTDVGAYTGTTSPYGAFDMGGNALQWNEGLIDGLRRVVRGGSFSLSSDYMAYYARGTGFGPEYEDADSISFRLASVPEPSTIVLALLACPIMWHCRKRFVAMS